jgi:hypothetical protein
MSGLILMFVHSISLCLYYYMIRGKLVVLDGILNPYHIAGVNNAWRCNSTPPMRLRGSEFQYLARTLVAVMNSCCGVEMDTVLDIWEWWLHAMCVVSSVRCDPSS